MSVLGPLARTVLNAGRYTVTASKVSRAARAGASMSAAARATRAARVARADELLISRLAPGFEAAAPGRAILPSRILDMTAGLNAEQKRALGTNLRTLLELNAVDPRLLRSVTAGSRFPGLRDPVKLLRWLESDQGRAAIARAPESRVYQEIARNADQADSVRAATAAEYQNRRRNLAAGEGMVQGHRIRANMEQAAGTRQQMQQAYRDLRSRTAAQDELDDAFAPLPAGPRAMPGTGRDVPLPPPPTVPPPVDVSDVDQTIGVLDALQRARPGALPVRGLLRELARSGDERAKAFLRSAGKLEAPEPIPGQPGRFRIRSRDGRVYDLDVRSEQVRNTPTGQSFFGRIERELGDAGLSPEEVANRVAQSGAVALDPNDTVLSRFVRRGQMDPGGTVNKALLATAGAVDIGYFAGPPIAEGVQSAFGFQDDFDEEGQAAAKRDLVLRQLREQRRARTFVANEARLAALAPDLYNEALAGRRLAPGSRVYGAPQKTDDLMGLLEMMSVGQSRQAFGL
jgi:hypothetical protein